MCPKCNKIKHLATPYPIFRCSAAPIGGVPPPHNKPQTPTKRIIISPHPKQTQTNMLKILEYAGLTVSVLLTLVALVNILMLTLKTSKTERRAKLQLLNTLKQITNPTLQPLARYISLSIVPTKENLQERNDLIYSLTMPSTSTELSPLRRPAVCSVPPNPNKEQK